MMKGSLSIRAAWFGVTCILSGFLLSLYPYYPLYVILALALVLGVVALESPSLGLLVAMLLSFFGATYQDPLIGLTYVVVLVITLTVIGGTAELAYMAGSWVLAFFFPPSLAILPTVLAGLHETRQKATGVGALSGISIFLLSWTRGIQQNGLMLVPFPSSYAAKPIPEPWDFTAFLPNAEVLGRLNSYFTTLASNIGDFRIYIFLASWAIVGYLVALTRSRLGGAAQIGVSVVTVLPPIIVSAVFAQIPLLEIGIVLVATAVAVVGYQTLKPRISMPTLPVFSGLDDLVPRGIPQKYSVLLGSPTCDERDLAVQGFIRLALRKNAPCLVLTSSMSFANSITSRFGAKLKVIVANPRAIGDSERNLIALVSGVQNLSALNIELAKIAKEAGAPGARMCLDILSDVLLSHKLLMTRKWLSDMLPRLENWGFATLSVLNPSLHSKEEVQGLAELFNGYVDIFEREYAGRSRKFIVVRKMSDLSYNENELLIDKQLLSGKRRLGVIRRSLAV